MSSLTPDIHKGDSPALAGPMPVLFTTLLHPWALPLALVLVLSVVVGALAYQAPPGGEVRVGWLGDQLFLDSYSGLGAAASERGDFYPDELTPDSPTGRSRWTRAHAQLVLPNLGASSELRLTVLAQGWPTDVRDPPQEGVQRNEGAPQPTVTVAADGQTIGSFVPSPQWQPYQFDIPASANTQADLTLTFDSSATFTNTERGSDARPKGVRLAEVQVTAPEATPAPWLPPAWRAVGLLTLAALLFYILLLRLLRAAAPGFLLTALCTGAAGVGLALARIWMGAALLVVVVLLLVALAIAWQRPLLRLFRMLLRRYSQGRALNYGLVAAALAWLGLVLAQSAAYVQQHGMGMGFMRSMFPDSLLFGLLSVGLLALVLVLGREGLPRIADAIVTTIGRPRIALLLLLILGGVWLSYEAAVVARLPYVGHADYADNAVVARNIVEGRGWVVDYVSQFYKLNPEGSTTRPQETWPLLQPVWMAPFIALFGAEAWAAKLPNLIFNALLLLLIYHAGAHIWDRRVGLLAALLTLTNHLFFRLTIYTTSDLGFVLFSMAAIFTMYRAVEQFERAAPAASSERPWWRPAAAGYLAGSGVLTGLMMLQKPSGALIAVGIGLWLIFITFAPQRGALRRLALRFGLWAGLALLVLSPYMARNMALFDAPVYSTERYDAWVLGYRGERAWDDIYRVYVPELGGPGLPDRSWILRWGFDYTYDKFDTQLTALRDYLMPVWPGQPAALLNEDGQPYLFSRNEAKNLIMPLGAWLSLIGFIAALRARRRLLFLLALAFTPYTLFLLTYWRTNEERYFLMVMPWLLLLACWMIWAGYDRLAAVDDRRWSPLALILVGVAVVNIVQPSWPQIADKAEREPQVWAPDVRAYTWIDNNLPPDAVLMTRNPWQLNWHTGNPAVMIPNTGSADLFFFLADYYDAEYIVFENLQRVKGDALQVIGPQANARDVQPGEVIEGFELVYGSPTELNRTLVYRLPERAADEEG